MFKEFTVPYDQGPGRSGSVLIHDDNFIESSQEYNLFDAVADVYERKGLPVAPNIALAIVERARIIGEEPQHLIERNASMNWYRKYANQLDKYLILL